MKWHQLNVMITGGTGSFGKAFVREMLDAYHPKRLIVFSRDELKQHEMRIAGFDDPCLRYFIGDVRDLERLKRAMRGVDIVIHAAALKQILSCEYNPFEAVKTNVYGAQNIINAAIDTGVKKVLALSTDKAVNPVNLYGATKLCADKIFVNGNSYSGTEGTRFSCVRYGNVINSRGSVIPLFQKQRETGSVSLTDKRMTRFWLTIEQAVRFVIRMCELMVGGEIFVPRIPSMTLVDLIAAVAPDCKVDLIGIRPGEKLHEILITEEDGRHTVLYKDIYIIQPRHSWWGSGRFLKGAPLPEGFRFASDTNDLWLSVYEMRAILAKTPLLPSGSDDAAKCR